MYAGPLMGKMFLLIIDANSKWKDIHCVNSTSSSVRVTTELHEKHAHAYLDIAVLAIRSVNTCVYCTKQDLVFLLQQRSLPEPVHILTAHPRNELVGLAAGE